MVRKNRSVVAWGAGVGKNDYKKARDGFMTEMFYVLSVITQTYTLIKNSWMI